MEVVRFVLVVLVVRVVLVVVVLLVVEDARVLVVVLVVMVAFIVEVVLVALVFVYVLVVDVVLVARVIMLVMVAVLVLLRIAPHPGGTNDNDDHACKPNNITVQNKIIPKILPVNKFTTLKFLSLLPSMNGYFFLDYYVLPCNTCLYGSVHIHWHHCHLSPPG